MGALAIAAIAANFQVYKGTEFKWVAKISTMPTGPRNIRKLLKW